MDDRERKRDSARKKREYSIYSQKAVRAKEVHWTKEQQRAVGQNKCLAQAKGSSDKKEPSKK